MSETVSRTVLELPSIPGIVIRSSKDILNPASKLAQLIWSPSGYGKTTLAGGLDELTQKYEGKRTLYIALEASDGGGAATIRKLDVPLWEPTDWNDLYRGVGALRNDKTIGGIVIDSATELMQGIVKPNAMKYPSRDNTATRSAGVPEQGDYQVMAELCSQLFRMLLGMTKHPQVEYRKHLIITAADNSKTENRKSDKVVWIGPALPGRMAKESVQMFQQVGTLRVKTQVVDGKRVNKRFLTFQGDGIEALKDRYEIYPEEVEIRKVGGTSGETLCSMYEKFWLPQVVR